MTDDRQERFDAEVVVDQEHAGGAFADGDADVALGLCVVEHVDHRQHHRARRFEQFVESSAIHRTVPAGQGNE